jgi:hypothetical protein
MIQQTDDAKKLAPRMGGDGDLDQYLQNIWSQRDLRPVGGILNHHAIQIF